MPGFQQRHSQGWDTPAQLASPTYQAGKFYDALLAVPGLIFGGSERLAWADPRRTLPALLSRTSARWREKPSNAVARVCAKYVEHCVRPLR